MTFLGLLSTHTPPERRHGLRYPLPEGASAEAVGSWLAYELSLPTVTTWSRQTAARLLFHRWRCRQAFEARGGLS